MTTPPSNIAEMSDQIAPSWLSGPTAQKFRYCMSLIWDGVDDGAAYAVRARFPLCAPDDALPFLSSDRQIDQGPGETQDSYRVRLTEWLDLWRQAGSPQAVMEALDAVFEPNALTIETVNDSILSADITSWSVATLGVVPPTQTNIAPHNWNWDGFSWPGRSWVIIQNGPYAQTPLWGAFRWGDGTRWGFNADPNLGAAVRGQIAKWQDAGTAVWQVILAFDNTWFLPNSVSAKLPDGSWGTWGTKKTLARNLGSWVQTVSATKPLGVWGHVVNTAQSRVWGVKQSHTTTSVTASRVIEPTFSHTTTTVTVPVYTQARSSTACYLGPVGNPVNGIGAI